MGTLLIRLRRASPIASSNCDRPPGRRNVSFSPCLHLLQWGSDPPGLGGGEDVEAVAKTPLLVLLDSHALVHRAFHAIQRSLATKSGEPTAAVFGFTQMLLKVLADYAPTHAAAAFDAPGPTFRHQLASYYKANRARAPDELRVQFPRVHQMVEAWGIPVFEREGYEADDLLGALAEQAAQKGIDTIIVTGDLDTVQLVGPRVRILTPRPMRPFSDTILYDEAQVRQRYGGLGPGQMVDLKALMGDASDNIPGVKGIGEKTAIALLQRFGSLEALYQRIGEVTPSRVRDLLLAHREEAERSQKLATIVRDLPVSLDLEACRLHPPGDAVRQLFQELEFSALLPRLPKGQEAAHAPTLPLDFAVAERDYRVVADAASLRVLCRVLEGAPQFAVDLETTSLEPRRAAIVGLSLAVKAGQAFYVPVGHREGAQLPLETALAALRPYFRDTRKGKVAHHAKFDMTALAEHGVELEPLAFDTMIAAHLLGERSVGLKSLAFTRLGMEMTPITDLIGVGKKQRGMDEVSIAAAAPYACADADFTLRLKLIFEEELRREGLWDLFSYVETPLVPVLVQMERDGIALDVPLLERYGHELGARMGELELAAYNTVGHIFKINSPQALGRVLFEELQLPRARRTKTGYSTDAAVLESLIGQDITPQARQVLKALLDYRQLAKLKSTYVDALIAQVDVKTGRLYTSFNQTATATGRLSSSEPNLQNIPIRTEEGRTVRRAFIPRPGWLLLSADYSQIDLRVLAYFSQDPNLLAAFRADQDIHRATASQVFGVEAGAVTPDMRRVAKTVNFGVIYGMTDYGLVQATELSREEARQFITSYFQRYPGVLEYLENTKRQARERGYVQTLLGRRRYIPEVNSARPLDRQEAERQAINMPIQGTSADIAKLAMLAMHRALRERALQSRMLLQIHDELLFEVPPGEVEVVRALAQELMPQVLSLGLMPQALPLAVPLKVDLKAGRNWEEMS
ncbi:MAG: DNA polymerase I [Chloroflexi bacterium]|nr:DNA polymerase I [Chloroflexota bacterium]